MAKEARVVICFPVRNEEKYLKPVLDSIAKQTLKPVRVIIANDGSTDKTKEIALSYPFVEVYDRPKREHIVTGKIEMAKVWNDSITPSLELDKKEPLDYILFLGGDLVLSETYIEDLVNKFEKDPKLMAISGKMVGKDAYHYSGFMTPGGGRMMRYQYWKKIGGKYPLLNGWEAYPIYRAQLDGYKTGVMNDIEYYPLRPTGGNTDYYAYGQAMKAYGYFFPFAIGRCLKQIFTRGRGFKVAWNMLMGYLFGKTDYYENEIRNFVKQSQKRRLKKIIFRSKK